MHVHAFQASTLVARRQRRAAAHDEALGLPMAYPAPDGSGEYVVVIDGGSTVQVTIDEMSRCYARQVDLVHAGRLDLVCVEAAAR